MTYLEDLHRFEDQEQARTVSHPPTTLLFDTQTGRVLTGRHRGLDLDDVATEVMVRIDRAGYRFVLRIDPVQPWWRFGRPTKKACITTGARK